LAAFVDDLVSVIMPAYNSEIFLAQAIKSILNQSLQKLELIVVDDGSTDKSSEIINSFTDNRIIHLRQSNQGYPNAMNAGLEIAKGRYVARMDADDISHPERLYRQKEILDHHPEFVFVGTRSAAYTPNGSLYKPSIKPNEMLILESWETIVDGKRAFADASVMFRAEDAKKVGFYRTYQRSGMDVDLWLRLLESGKQACTINDHLYWARMHLDQLAFSDSISLNQIPRILARERKANGSDRVMRGEGTTGLLQGDQVEVSRLVHLNNLLYCSEICFKAADLSSAYRFASAASKYKTFPQVIFYRVLKGIRNFPRSFGRNPA
jgi:glycosyltransferase involved in cell wall biosynthesis